MLFVRCHRGSILLTTVSVVAFVFAPVAAADTGSPSYNQGKQAIDDQILNRHVQLTPSDDLQAYCLSLLGNVTKSGMMPSVNVPSDFMAGCQDEGHVLVPGQ
jgi:hypothetical protein